MWMKTRGMSYGDVIEALMADADFDNIDTVQRPPDEEELEDG